ncbi:aminoglycoside phosphotransferase [Streptomyces sp. WAC 06738]|uniref:aminoglycoside phosphotransferase family protein n=1 Tax=Streptomyces sp. WAC 06738 TaxID=2203210 RepID=UPI000F6F83DF|nr:aminoglycoside phosphotransferase family protein [Streptomyces sp. WAC 06738]AZM48023.1 aminoglycoside phosphotransferase [Streptomyces sp. WAC 06738]
MSDAETGVGPEHEAGTAGGTGGGGATGGGGGGGADREAEHGTGAGHGTGAEPASEPASGADTDAGAGPEITADLIRELLREQHPDLADRPLTLGARGWDNQLWRLGDDLAVRLPWATESADELLRKEHAWLPELAAHLPLPVPVPQRIGEPSERFRRPWIVTTWVPGTPADRAPVTRGPAAADALAAFLTALHRPAPGGAPAGRGRGGPLSDASGWFEQQLAEAAGLGLVADADAVRAVWDDAVAAPLWSGPALWQHGDLHPANVLTADGTLCGVVDFGDLCAGDPALDLAAAWILLPDDAAAERFLTAYGPAVDAATLRRARGVAVMRALVGLLVGEAGVRGRKGGKATWGPPARASLRRLLADAERG